MYPHVSKLQHLQAIVGQQLEKLKANPGGMGYFVKTATSPQIPAFLFWCHADIGRVKEMPHMGLSQNQWYSHVALKVISITGACVVIVKAPIRLKTDKQLPKYTAEV